MFSLFSQNKKALEEEKIEKLEKSQEMPKKPPSEDPLMNFDRIKKSEIEKQILLKRRREPNISAELLETSYKKRLTNMNKAISLKTFLQESNDLTCPICMDTIMAANTTICGHTFCEQCLLETLLLNTGCPLCRTPLRTFQMTYSKALDQIIEKWVMQSSNKEAIQNFEKRKKDHGIWNETRLIKSAEEGDELDVRDTEYIWCVGIVLKKIVKPNKPSIFLIHYQGWNKIYDEFISENSFRLAPLGFYTKRKDIPQYLLHSNNQDVMYGYVIIGNREVNLNNPNPNMNIPNANPNLFILQNGNLNPGQNQENANNENEERPRMENHQINRNQRAMSRVGYTELRNLIQIRINLFNENQGNQPLPIPSENVAAQENSVQNEQASSSLMPGMDENASIFTNEVNQNISQINPANETLTVVSFPNNNQEMRETESEILGLIEQANIHGNQNTQNAL